MKKSTKIILWSILACLLLGAAGWLGWTWYDNNVDRSGWREKDGMTIYADFHGKPVTGWLDINGSRYYFGEDHVLQTGWLETNGGTYYLNDDGKMQTLWLDFPDGRCFFGEDGILRTSWQEIGENRYYFGEEGRMHTGWLELNEVRHFFLEDGTLASGWQKIDSATYYLDENGTPAAGWLEWEENRYCFDESGRMLTGWQDLDGERYYFEENGVLHTGWLETSSGRYYFEDSGAMTTGWLEQGEYLYYLLPEGIAATGQQEIDGKTHYFTPKGIRVLLVNPWNPLPEDYEPELVEVENGHYVDAVCLDALKAMMEAMRAADLLPLFSSTYRNKADQRWIWNKYVQGYLDAGYDEATANAMTAAFVAVPGTSEHHTGLAVDIVGHDYYYSGHPGSTMDVQAWLKEHCWEYGFILRYTKEKQSITGFAPETWHFRYVGTEVSLDMKDSGLCLEEYLGARKG